MAKVVCFVFGLLFITACAKGGDQVTREKGSVLATGKYQELFGPAPAVEKGRAYAFVLYFPSAHQAGKLVPLPFFSFSEKALMQAALGRLVAGMGDVPPYREETLQAFPPGTTLVDLSRDKGVVTALFSKELAAVDPGSPAGTALRDAVVLTLGQFEGVSEVRIVVQGQRLDFGGGLPGTGAASVLPLRPPRLLSLTAMKEKDGKIEEVDAFFDRPVQIRSIEFLAPDGAPLKGEVYHATFDMAGVLKPDQPERLAEGMRLKIRWDVVDYLGRAARGEGAFPLVVKEHAR